jgi:histidyl-tRNA synthetase
MLAEGLAELAAVIRVGAERAPGVMVADLKIARGLDYYTGTVYETQLIGFESYGSICSGGRYDALASDGRTTYPGVGISIGLSRLLAKVMPVLSASRSTPTCVLVALADETDRGRGMAVAAELRRRGIAAEVAPAAAKFGKQIMFAQRRGIPFVWFMAAQDQSAPGEDSVKDIRSGEQARATASAWTPPAEDLRPQVLG